MGAHSCICSLSAPIDWPLPPPFTEQYPMHERHLHMQLHATNHEYFQGIRARALWHTSHLIAYAATQGIGV